MKTKVFELHYIGEKTLISLDALDIPEKSKKNKIKQLENANIHSIDDMVRFLPKKLIDCNNPQTSFKQYIGITEPVECAIIGKIDRVVVKNSTVYAVVRGEDNTYVYVYWYNQSYVRTQLLEHETYIFCGEIKYYEPFNQIQMSPFDFSCNTSNISGFYPIYKIEDMAVPYAANLMKQALALYPKEDWLEDSVKKELNLMDEYEAIRVLHNPQNEKELKMKDDAILRLLIFDELFYFNFKLKNLEKINRPYSDFPITSCTCWHKAMKKLPFQFTKDQQDTLSNMYKLMRGNYRLNSLVQGDVGSGKTMVAIFLALLGLEHGYQTVVIAPTEVLASQHYEEFLNYLEDEDKDKVCLLIGSLTKKQKETTKEKIKNQEYKIIIGTHAVIQPSVEYPNLGFVIVDEQHRFGVEQREDLLRREKIPHYVNLSATPIPRTLSMAIYGNNIQVFNILTKPNGRLPIITKKINTDNETNQLLLNEIEQGHQAYVVCPLIKKSKSEKMVDVDAVEVVYEKLQKDFKPYPNVRIGMINGDMKKKDIEEIIQRFFHKEMDILVSTTIIEVGVNVPNATIIAIKNSERFGLSTLHQLRGRVGRNSLQSYCLLQTPKDDIKAKVMCSTTDGFEIARRDLKLRGPGDFIGSKQSGQNKYILLMLEHELLYNKINNINNTIFNNPQRYDTYKFIEDMQLYEVIEDEDEKKFKKQNYSKKS